MPLPAEMDNGFEPMIRAHIQSALAKLIVPDGYRVLEVGPPNPRVVTFGRGVKHYTLDLKPGCNYHADITKQIPEKDGFFDLVICMEVLEHCRDPFAALKEIRRVTKEGGLLLASAPLNLRQHGPQPDCWRFTHNGWLTLLKDWDDVTLHTLDTPERPLFPLHYTAMATCNKEKDVDPATMEAEWITR